MVPRTSLVAGSAWHKVSLLKVVCGSIRFVERSTLTGDCDGFPTLRIDPFAIDETLKLD